MHLMYTLDESGNRVYTLKVGYPILRMRSSCANPMFRKLRTMAKSQSPLTLVRPSTNTGSFLEVNGHNLQNSSLLTR